MLVRYERWLVALVLGLAALGVHGLASRNAAADAMVPYRIVENWPRVPAGMKWGEQGEGGASGDASGAGVALDAAGIVYFFHRDSGQISKWDTSGRYLGDWGLFKPGYGKGGHALFFNRDGTVWVVERDRHMVRKFAADGRRILISLGTDSTFGESETTFNGPTGLATLPNGDIVVSDGYWNSRLVWFDKNGKFLKSVGTWGRGPAEFHGLHSVILDPSGRLLVADICAGDLHPEAQVPGQIAAYRHVPGCKDNRIQVLDRDGKYLGEWPVTGTPLSLLVVGNRLLVGAVSPKIQVLDLTTGQEVETLDGLSDAHQMAMDAHGDLYIASIASRSKNLPWAPLRKFTGSAK